MKCQNPIFDMNYDVWIKKFVGNPIDNSRVGR